MSDTGIAVKREDRMCLKFDYSYTQRCRCHPETCCCSGYDRIWDSHTIEVINPTGMKEGERYKFELREVQYESDGSRYTVDRVYILD